ncbi:rhamnulokinase [Ktedonospora formicarum]|uniref:Carbohydrate kinase n=1 Tax=Ktedonospora formicarum TaxID=2778364 RepID=A0A8J3I1G2_9CHLR|nr:rhamnulokinase family protein [Ktedonospora formicarum]GHO48272.1 carbohydrate kinase [Ktedonospora formicarum]
MPTRNVAAVDLGAESGRVMLARFDGQYLQLEEVYRFPNRPVTVDGHRFWNIQELWRETLAGLRKARTVAGSLDSIGVDTWAVDYGLVDSNGELLGQPFQYRDQRTKGVMESVFARVPRQEIYAQTGIQFLPFNTLYQLAAHQRDQPEDLTRARNLLMIPDLLHSWLCGSQVTERTNASTTQCWNPVTGAWTTDLLARLDIPSPFLPPVVEPGTVLGEVLPELRAELGNPRIIAPATHDTGSAIAAAPFAQALGRGYISSGTWSLVGLELPHPIMTSEACEASYTNEGGICGTTRFLKNVMGLWLLQECQRQWHKAGQASDYDTLLAQADNVEPFAALIDPDDPRFLAPEHMPDTINAYLLECKQSPLQAPAAFARCIMESLVLRYCEVLLQLERLSGTPLEAVHVLGGGSRNVRLNQWLADASGRPVIAGPVEATALGNALMQLVGLGELRDLDEVRAIARATPTHTFMPRQEQRAAWNEAAQRFRSLKKG